MRTKLLTYLLLLAVGFATGWWARGRYCPLQPPPEGEVTCVVDTIPYHYPVPRDSTVVRYEVVRLQVADTARVTVCDTVRVADSVRVVVPITRRVYEDSLYRAVVSGYRPRLDSITVYRPTRYVTVKVADRRRWGIGLQAGCGVGKGGLSPYVGIGVSYNLFTF